MTITMGLGGYIVSIVVTYILQRLMVRFDEEFMTEGALGHFLCLFIPFLNVALYVGFLLMLLAVEYVFPFLDKHTTWAEKLYKRR